MKRILIVILCAAITIFGFTGCAQQAGETSQATAAEESAAQAGSDSIYGQVKAVSSDEATIALGTMAGGMGGGTPPDMENSDEQSGGTPPDMPGGEAPSGDAQSGGTPPDMPGGEAPSGDAQSGGTPPDMPNEEAPATGEQDGGTPPDMGAGGPGGGMGAFTADEDGTEITVDLAAVTIVKQGAGSEEEASAADLTEGTIVKMEGSGEGTSFVPVVLTIVTTGGLGGDMAGSETGSIELTGVLTVDGTDDTSNGEELSSSSSDENAVLIKGGGSLVLTNGTLHKIGDTSSADESNFYAVNAIFAASGGSTAQISGSTLTSGAEGANAIFATGEESVITVDDVAIHTTGNSSGGLDATYGGTVNATNVDITTEGAHCAPIAPA